MISKTIISRVTIISLLAPSFVFAALPKTVDQVVGRLQSIAGDLFSIAMVVGIIFVIYAAFQYVTAGGDSEKVGNANKTMLYAVIGIAVALIASGVPALIESILGK